jgi:hypothetical protein
MTNRKNDANRLTPSEKFAPKTVAENDKAGARLLREKALHRLLVGQEDISAEYLRVAQGTFPAV